MFDISSQHIKDFTTKPLFTHGRNAHDPSLPKISIITPSYNQAAFLERTILSVLNQNYPNLEYIIIDGGSTDGSVEIIKKYEKYLTYWVSEKDNGQSDAINKGFLKSTGVILGWINSDDTYESNALSNIAECFLKNLHVSLVYGNGKLIDVNDNIIVELRSVPATLKALIYDGCNLNQASAFWKRDVFFECGMLNPNLDCAMEYELFYKIFSMWKTKHIPTTIANLRIHPNTKTKRLVGVSESERTQIAKIYISNYPANRRFWKFIYALRRYFFYVVQRNGDYLFTRLYQKISGGLRKN